MIENGQDKQSGDSQKKQRKCQKRPGNVCGADGQALFSYGYLFSLEEL